MSKKSGVSINFDSKKMAKDLANQFEKKKKNIRISGECPSCKKKTNLNFRNGKAKCSRCGVVVQQD